MVAAQRVEKRRRTTIGSPSAVSPTISWVAPGGSLPWASAFAASPLAISPRTNEIDAGSFGTICSVAAPGFVPRFFSFAILETIRQIVGPVTPHKLNRRRVAGTWLDAVARAKTIPTHLLGANIAQPGPPPRPGWRPRSSAGLLSQPIILWAQAVQKAGFPDLGSLVP